MEHKSKEEILRSEYEKIFSSQKYDKSVNRGMNFDYISPAMDEYAKQQAKAFAEWTMEHYYSIIPGYYSKLPKSFEPVGTGYPIERIYAEFLTEHQSKL